MLTFTHRTAHASIIICVIMLVLFAKQNFAHSIDSLLMVAENTTDQQELAKVHHKIANQYFVDRKYRLAEDHMKLSKLLSADDTTSLLYNENLLSLSRLYLRLELFKKALLYASNSGNIADLENRDDIYAASLLNAAFALKEMSKNEAARQSALGALAVFEEQKDSLSIGIACNILGMISKNLEAYEEAARFYKKSWIIRKKWGTTKDQLVILGNIANLFKLQGEYDSARHYYNYVGQLAAQSGEMSYHAGNYLNFAELMLLMADTASAFQYLDSSLELANYLGLVRMSRDISKLLAHVYYAQKKYDTAWVYIEKFVRLNDSVRSLDHALNYDQLKILLDNQTKQTRIEKLQKQNARNSRIFHVSLIVALLVILSLLYLRSVKIKKTRDLLDASEKKYRMLAENSVEVIWSSDLDLMLTYVSPSTEQLFGFPSEERLNIPMLEVFGLKSYQELKQKVSGNMKLIKQGKKPETINLELQGKQKNGHEVWIELTADFSYNERDEIIGLQGIARDITERKLNEIKTTQILEDLNLQDEELKAQNEELIEARRELEKTAEQYFDLFENGPVGYLILDSGGVVLELNSTSAQMLGKAKNEILEKSFLMSIATNEKRDFSGIFMKTLKDRKVHQHEFTLLSYKVRIVFVPDIVEGKIRCRLAMVDITAEAEAREKLSIALQSLQTVFDAIPGGIIVIDKHLSVVNINRRLQKIQQIKDRSEVIGKKCYDVFNCGKQNCDSCVWNKVVKSGKTLVRHSSPEDPVFRDGSYRIYSSPMFDIKGHVIGVVEAAMDISDLRKAELALEDSERKFKDLFNDIPDAVFITKIGEKSGEILDVNAAAESQTGYSRDELLGMNVLNDISAKGISRELTKEREYHLVNDNKIEVAEQKRRKDGTLIWTEVVIQKIVIQGQKLALSVSRDITERVKIQDDLRKSEARVRSILGAMPDLLFILDKKGNFLEYHASSHEHLLMSPEKFLEKNLSDVLPANLAEMTMKNIGLTFGTGEMQVYGYHIDRDGERYYYDARMIKASENTVLTIVRDITDAHRAEEDRRQNEEKYKTIFLNTPLGLFNFDSNGVIINCNDHFVKILGSSREALIGFDMMERLHELELKRTIKQVIENGSGNYQGDYKSVTSGKITPIRAFFKAIYTDNNEFVDGIGIVEDVSEQREYEDKLLAAKQKAEESDRLKSSFMATMSHELRTPLNTVIGFSDMIEESMPIDQVIEFTEIISKSGRHLLSIIEDILDISLIDSSEVKLAAERFFVNELMEGLYNFAIRKRIDMVKDHVEVEVVVPEQFKQARLSGDLGKINKVFGHLINNALKFTRKGKVVIGIEERSKTTSPDYVLLYVKDTGIGIPKDKQDIIFEIFRQIDDTSTREFEGTGLGLAISKKLIMMMGGSIWLRSEPEKGSTFYFELPLKAGTVQTIQTFNKYIKPEVKTMKGITVLVAEDDDTNFHLFKLLLNRRQIDVIRAKNGEESIEAVSANANIRMVLMDINMPVLNGYEATKKIKEMRNDLPVIAVTAYAMSGDKESAEEAGCDDYITKPINNQVFYETITKYL